MEIQMENSIKSEKETTDADTRGALLRMETMIGALLQKINELEVDQPPRRNCGLYQPDYQQTRPQLQWGYCDNQWYTDRSDFRRNQDRYRRARYYRSSICCWRYGKIGHIARECKEQQDVPNGSSSSICCWRCGKISDIASELKSRKTN